MQNSMTSMRKILLSLLLISISSLLTAQSVTDRFKSHITYLADDKLKGRDTGSEGEWMAADYIIEQFKTIGLKPAGAGKDANSVGWRQPFDFVASRTPSEECMLRVGNRSLGLGGDFQVFPETGDAEASGPAVAVGFGIYAPGIGRDDYKAAGDVKGKIVVIERGTPEPDNPHSKFAEYAPFAVKIEAAVKMGAAGIVFVNPEGSDMDDPILSFTQRTNRQEIPIVWYRGEAGELMGKELKLRTALLIDKRTGNNVVGYIDHGAELTIIIGAHYDHLGMGDEGSLHRGEAAIHNGADDNASGTGMIIEMARALITEPYKKFNYLFIAFSGEEKGLLGSNYYSKNPTIDLTKVNCMINFDMVGRLDKEKNTLGINGVGTSPAWNEMLEKIQPADFKIKTSESGVGPSDHTSFYLKDIPVLHFFSGTHSDYHKPSDDENLINYAGMDKIYGYMMALMGQLTQQSEQLAFSTTKTEDPGGVPRWKVSLGVIPDYMFDGEGMRIDGVTEGRPASKAGLKVGDVVVQMGEHKVTEMMSYMRALAAFEKGDEVKVTVMRNGKAKKKKVTF
jgi:hypothetical protein